MTLAAHRTPARDVSWQCLGDLHEPCPGGWCQCDCHTDPEGAALARVADLQLDAGYREWMDL